jgi:EEF1A lysine methyltransferase 4
VLRDDGVFLYVTFRQAHFVQPLLNPGGIWDVHMEVLGDEGSFGYSGYVMKKIT